MWRSTEMHRAKGLLLLRPRPGESSRSWGRVPTHNTAAHIVLHVPASDVKNEGLDQVRRKPFASKLLSTH